MGEDRGRPLLWLEIKDWSGEAQAKFAPDELKNPRQTSSKIIRLWGDLLQTRSHKQVADLEKQPSRLSGEEVLDRIWDAIYDFSEKNGDQPRLLKLPVRYAVALMKLGASFWGDFFHQIRESGVRSIESQRLFGVHVQILNGVNADLEVE